MIRRINVHFYNKMTNEDLIYSHIQIFLQQFCRKTKKNYLGEKKWGGYQIFISSDEYLSEL